MLVRVDRLLIEKNVKNAIQHAERVTTVYERGDMVDEWLDTMSDYEILCRFLAQISGSSHYYITVSSEKLEIMHKYL